MGMLCACGRERARARALFCASMSMCVSVYARLASPALAELSGPTRQRTERTAIAKKKERKPHNYILMRASDDQSLLGLSTEQCRLAVHVASAVCP